MISKCRKLDLSVDIHSDLCDVVHMRNMGVQKDGYIVKATPEIVPQCTLKVKMTTSINMVYGKLGGYPPCAAVEERFIGSWVRLLKSKKSKETKPRQITYNYLLNLHVSGIYGFPD